MKLFGKIFSSLYAICAKVVVAAAQIPRRIYKRIARMSPYFKGVAVYLLVIGILVGALLWRAQSYYPEIPLGREKNMDDAAIGENDSRQERGNFGEDIELDPGDPGDPGEEGEHPPHNLEDEEDEAEGEDRGEDRDEDSGQLDDADGKGTESATDEEDSDAWAAGLSPGEIQELVGELAWPLEAEAGEVKSEFGDFIRHQTSAGENIRFQVGIKIGASGDDPVRSAASGEVIKVNEEDIWYGTSLIVEHQQGVQTVYGNVQDVNVSQGQQVEEGDLLGKIGQDPPIKEAVVSQGQEEGSFLYFKLKVKGEPVDPLPYLPN